MTAASQATHVHRRTNLFVAGGSFVLGIAASYAFTCYFAALMPAESLPLMGRLYEQQATLEDLVPTSGERNHHLRAEIPERVRPNETYVAWVAPLTADGSADYRSVFPYLTLSPGETHDFMVNAGGKGDGDLNTYYAAQVCRVRGPAMAKVNAYFGALTYGGDAEKRNRALGISLTAYTSSFDCAPTGSIVIRRTQ